MKKIVAMFIMAILTVQVAIAGDVVTKDVNQLPASARETIKKHFPQAKISYIKIDKDLLKSKTYEATLTNGTEIDFNSKGEWTDIDCKKAAVPAAFVPASISQYVKENFAGHSVVKIERERKMYKVELNNGLDLNFDKMGAFLRMDD